MQVDRCSRRGVMLTTGWLLRLILSLYAVMAVAQPVLAGSYLSGNFDAISAHGLNGGMLMPAAMLTFPVALCHWLLGRGSGWPVAVVAALFLAQGLQIGMGYSRQLMIHIPLGVAIVATVLAVAVWSWTPRLWRQRHLWRSGRPAPVVAAADVTRSPAEAWG